LYLLSNAKTLYNNIKSANLKDIVEVYKVCMLQPSSITICFMKDKRLQMVPIDARLYQIFI